MAGRCPLDGAQLGRLEQLAGVPLADGASHSGNRGPQLSFNRPALSPCLAGLTNREDPRYQEALAIISAGRDRLAQRSEADGDAFVPCAVDQWREEKYQARRRTELRNREAIHSGVRVYESK